MRLGHMATADRAAQRAMGLAALVCRAHMETAAADRKAKEMQGLVIGWLEVSGAGAGLDTTEHAFLAAPLGTLGRDARARALWRVEQIGVLAWALGRAPLARHDESPADRWLARKVGFLSADARTQIALATLRPAGVIGRYAARAVALEARLRSFALDERPMPFQAFCAEHGITGIPFLAGDLAVAGLPLVAAPLERWQPVLCAAVERSQAARWLLDPERAAVRPPVDA
jgi:hypothetical protein